MIMKTKICREKIIGTGKYAFSDLFRRGALYCGESIFAIHVMCRGIDIEKSQFWCIIIL